MKVTSALATVLTATLCTTSALAQPTQSAPFRTIQSVTISADKVTQATFDAPTTLRVTMKVKDEVAGVAEQWDIVHTTYLAQGSSVSSLDINGKSTYIIKQSFIAGEVIASIQTKEGQDWASFNDYNSRPFYEYLVASVANERQLVVDAMNEFREFGVIQGNPVNFISEGAEVSTFPDSDSFGVADRDCRAEAEALYGPKPEDCEGAIDEYLCCVWEYYVDGAENACECDKLPWYKEVPCYAAITIGSGIDGLACVAGLPIPGA